jgi:hypothetical protein
VVFGLVETEFVNNFDAFTIETVFWSLFLFSKSGVILFSCKEAIVDIYVWQALCALGCVFGSRENYWQ